MTNVEPAASDNQELKEASDDTKIRQIVLGAGVFLAVIFILWLLPLNAYLRDILHWTEGLGVWGPIVIALTYVLASVLLLPGTILTMGAGFLLGVFTGTVTALVGSILGAVSAFLIGRTIARDWIAKKFAENRRFLALDRAVAAQGFKVVLLTRLSPVFPFNVLNYAFGLTRIPFWPYIVASSIGVIPGTIMYVYLGGAARSFAEIIAGEVEGARLQQSFFWGGLILTVAVVFYITRIARKALKENVPENIIEAD